MTIPTIVYDDKQQSNCEWEGQNRSACGKAISFPTARAPSKHYWRWTTHLVWFKSVGRKNSYDYSNHSVNWGFLCMQWDTTTRQQQRWMTTTMDDDGDDDDDGWWIDLTINREEGCQSLQHGRGLPHWMMIWWRWWWRGIRQQWKMKTTYNDKERRYWPTLLPLLLQQQQLLFGSEVALKKRELEAV